MGNERTGLDRRSFAKAGAMAASALALPAAAASRPGFARPRVEWRTDPVGLDTPRPRFRWTLAAPPHSRDLRQTGFRLIVEGGRGSGREGRTLLDTGWRSGAAMAFTPHTGLPLRDQAEYRWRLAVATAKGMRPAPAPAGRFVTGVLAPDGWRAGWISDGPDIASSAPAREWLHPTTGARRMPLLRAAFDETRRVSCAILSIAGLGQYALSLNGEAVAPGDLRPAWSDYAKRILYDTFDVTRLVRPGRIVIGVMLGNGFFNVEGVEGRYAKLVGAFGRPKLIAQLRLVFEDGRERLICTGDGWLAAPGPIIFSSVYGGEDVDARLTPQNWDQAYAAPPEFQPATPVASPGGRLQASGLPPVAVMQRYERPTISAPRPGVLVADFGRNFAGRPAATFTGLARGQTVTAYPGELLLVDGSVDQRSATGGELGLDGVAFTYVSDGAPVQTLRPRFSTTSFRYLQIEGVAREQIASLVGEFIHLDTPGVGRFACSDPQIEAIHALIVQAVRSNLASVITDCPHREKLGWLEQTYLNADTIMYNRDAAALYEKMAADIVAAQAPDGLVPSIAPEFVTFTTQDGASTPYRDSPEWGCAVALSPWEAFRTYGDAAILHAGWPAMQAYAAHLEARSQGGLLNFGLGDWYDVGPNPPGYAQLTSVPFTGSATWYRVLTTLAQVAAVLGEPRPAADFRSRAERLRETINAAFLDRATARYDRGSQTAQAMALALGLAPPELAPAVLERLIVDIAARDDHLSAGDIGFHYVVRALTLARRPDVLARLLARTDAPSYGAQLARGATALTEAWDANPSSSQNHFCMGHVESWFYGAVGGVRMAFGEPGPPIVVAPQIPPGMTWAQVEFDSVLGPVRCGWRREGEGCRIDVAVPPGATARLELPAPPHAVAGAQGRRMQTTAFGGARLDVGSGRHLFQLARLI